MTKALRRRLYVWARNKYRQSHYNEWRVEANNIRKNGIAERLTDGLPEIVAERGDGKYVVNGVRVTVVGRHIVTVDTNQTDVRFQDFLKHHTNPIRGLEKLRKPGQHL